MMRYVRSFLMILGLILGVNANAQKLILGELFNEGAVLQQNKSVDIWGNANPNETVSISILGIQAKAKCDSSGKWETTIPALKSGGPYTLTAATSKDTICIHEIYVGEVWIAGGQSNMALPLEKTTDGPNEIAKATNQNIHFVSVPFRMNQNKKGSLKWKKAISENVGSMSGVAYYFTKKLQENLNVPIGIVCCYKGGTPAESWMSREKLLSDPESEPIVRTYENDLEAASAKNDSQFVERNYKSPYNLYECMLKRIIPYTAKGIIWYQGEANATRAEQYRTLFPSLIDEWRHDFKNATMPFLFVQLPSYDHPSYGDRPIWAELRESQLLTWQKDKNTAMAVTMDVGDKNTIHPTNKEPVGKRLASCALKKVYGMDVPYSGPVFQKAEFGKKEVVLSFDFVYDGLRSEGALKGFTICGKDKQFKPAQAIIRNRQVVVFDDSLEDPIAVRYNWSNWGEGNLFNLAGFPATPFRTDNFELLTTGVKTIKYQ
ncbi:MAG TPA: sialate O-acetylesterase [Bacteroidales bacterium]|nr:sialate O-acetylesterase [Bacteroidales bacterium]